MKNKDVDMLVECYGEVCSNQTQINEAIDNDGNEFNENTYDEGQTPGYAEVGESDVNVDGNKPEEEEVAEGSYKSEDGEGCSECNCDCQSDDSMGGDDMSHGDYEEDVVIDPKEALLRAIESGDVALATKLVSML